MRSNKAFTLIEVLIAVAILSTAVIFVFRSFTTSLSASRFAQNLSLACYLAQDKMWQVEVTDSKTRKAQDTGIEEIQNKDFNWKYEIIKTDIDDLNELKFSVSWHEKAREKEYLIEFFTLLLADK